MVHNFKGIIFDFDGVIVDSELFFLQSIQSYLQNKHITIQLNDIQFLIGQDLNKSAEDIKQKYGINDDIRIITQELTKCYELICHPDKIPPMPGIIDFIKTLKKFNIKMVIASSSPQDYLQRIMKRLKIDSYFEKIFSGQNFLRNKPFPDIYMAAVKFMDLPLDEIIVIEDSPNGIQAAKSSGLYTIGYKGSVITQNTSKADKEIYSFREILESSCILSLCD